MFSSALCATINCTFQKQYLVDICVHRGHHKTHLFLHHVYFETFYGLYIIWKELKQLQPQDQHQQTKTGNLLVQTSPPPEELLTEVREQLIPPLFMEQIYSGSSTRLSGT